MTRYEALMIRINSGDLYIHSTSLRTLEWTQAFLEGRVPGCKVKPWVDGLSFWKLKNQHTALANELFSELCHKGWKPLEWTYGIDPVFRLRWEGDSETLGG
jgi:hypothetical protein